MSTPTPQTPSAESRQRTATLAAMDHQYVWHPFTPMKQWRRQQPVIIERGEGMHLVDTLGRRYIDGVSSLWCNVHGHRVPQIDQAVRDQLDRIAHTTLLGLASPPSIELARRLVERAPLATPGKGKVFYSDAGATAVEAAFKMAVGYWHHVGKPQKHEFIGLAGAYHGDTTGSMSVGYSDLFHRPFKSMVFPTRWAPAPDAPRAESAVRQRALALAETLCPPCAKRGSCDHHHLPSQCPSLAQALREHCLDALRAMLEEHAQTTAAIVLEPVMQGAAGMICQPPGFVRGVAALAREFDVLLIADEVATGFGRTGAMFACELDGDDDFPGPDLLCLAKGITGGYLPLAATLATDRIEQAFQGELHERKTLYHGHTYTGNPLAAAAALASLDLFEQADLIAHIRRSQAIIADRLHAITALPQVLDIRQRGLMVGIELCRDRDAPGGPEPFDFAAQTGARVCMAMRDKGLIIRPLGNVLILMPIPAMPHELLHEMLDIVIDTLTTFDWDAD